MAYENEIDYNDLSREIQSDLLLNAKDITQAELFTDTENVKVPVIKTVDGIPQVGRMALSDLMQDVNDAAQEAMSKAQTAQTAAASAQSAATSAQSAAQSATQAAQEATNAIEDFQETLDSYFATTDQQVKSRIIELGQMAESGVLDVTVDSIQLFDDFRLATGFAGTYNDFLILLGQGGGGGGVIVDAAMSTTSVNPVQNKVISTALNAKQDIMDSLTTLDILSILN